MTSDAYRETELIYWKEQLRAAEAEHGELTTERSELRSAIAAWERVEALMSHIEGLNRTILKQDRVIQSLKARSYVITRPEASELLAGIAAAIDRCRARQRIAARMTTPYMNYHARWLLAERRLRGILILLRIASEPGKMK